MDAYEREEQALFDERDRGEITEAQLRKELRELQRDYAADAREAAQHAYDAELERW